ncbi:unnamed protein product [Strongylus vulgaris]|uniref:Uncharacterized protein n=1 Tax=Strongylus vulgaris TaxID=40348 RepID=A0A3P7JBT3_STRVU|nr:unnamed protein product [Strongylus vulgaris]
MAISPYKERGIALWSTMWESVDTLKSARKYKDQLYQNRYEDVLNNTAPQILAHPGIYIDEMLCDEEKYDCEKLAECMGISIKSKIDEEMEEEVDPCAEYETDIQTIFIDQEHSDIKVLSGQSYRIRLREEVFATDATKVDWRVSSRPPARYDTSRSCLEQGIVQLKSGDLLLTSLTSRDDQLYQNRYEDVLNNTAPQILAHPGIYIDEMLCNEEKYDCEKLAECMGISIKSKIDEEMEEEVDPCAEYETDIQTIFIDQEHSDIKVLSGQSYRIRLREEVFATDATKVDWRVSSRPPARYDTSRSCLEQGIVQLKSGDLLLTSLKSRDVRRRMIATLPDGRKINIQFHDAGVQLGLGEESGTVITWAIVIAVFVLLLYAFVQVTSNRRKARMQQILQNRMKKRLRAEKHK